MFYNRIIYFCFAIVISLAVTDYAYAQKSKSNSFSNILGSSSGNSNGGGYGYTNRSNAQPFSGFSNGTVPFNDYQEIQDMCQANENPDPRAFVDATNQQDIQAFYGAMTTGDCVEKLTETATKIADMGKSAFEQMKQVKAALGNCSAIASNPGANIQTGMTAYACGNELIRQWGSLKASMSQLAEMYGKAVGKSAIEVLSDVWNIPDVFWKEKDADEAGGE